MHNPDDRSPAGRNRDSLLISPLFGVLSLDFLVQSAPHPCPYLPSREAQEEVFKTAELHSELYHDFMDNGFRRSGDYFYRPTCPDCRECHPIRVPAAEFRLTKSQRRVRNKNKDIEVSVCRPTLTEEKLMMYADYLARQHGSTGDVSRNELSATLYASPVHTLEFEYRLNRRLVAVSIADLSSRSLSSVYVYYNVDLSSRSLGTFTALQEILFCQTQEIPYYYLGFFVPGCPAMSYKARFRPHETLDRDLSWNRQALPLSYRGGGSNRQD
jgi:leucyl-tRNA---protein transferase